MEEIVFIASSRLIPNTLVRADVQSKTAEHKLGSLERSLRARGIQTPLIVMPSEQGFLIVDGNRRYLAGVKAGFKKFPCILRESTQEKEAITITEVGFSANELRQDLSPSQETQAILSVSEKGGFIVEEIAASTGKSVGQIKKIRQRKGLSPPLMEMVDKGQISKSASLELAPLAPEEQVATVEALGEMGLSLSLSNIRLYRRKKEENLLEAKTKIQENIGVTAEELKNLKQIYSELEREVGRAVAVVQRLWRSTPVQDFLRNKYPQVYQDFKGVLKVLGEEG